jgi:hypothetical protein
MADNAVIEIMGKAPSVVKSKKSSKKESVETMLADILAAVKQINSKLYFINLPAQKGGEGNSNGDEGNSNESNNWFDRLLGPPDEADQVAKKAQEDKVADHVAETKEQSIDNFNNSEAEPDNASSTGEQGPDPQDDASSTVEQGPDPQDDASSTGEQGPDPQYSSTGEQGPDPQYSSTGEQGPDQVGGAVKNEKKIQSLIAELQSLLCKAKTTSKKSTPPAFWTGTGHNMRAH